MNKALKISLISIAVIGAGVGTYFVLKSKKRKKEEQKEKEQQEKEEYLEQATSNEASGQIESGADPNQGYIVPMRNRNGEVINPLSEVKGRMLYPAQDSQSPTKGYVGAQGKATLRTSAEVNNGTINNIITKYSAGTKIGTVIGVSKDELNPPMRWFKVKMAKPCCGIFSNYTVGYVRADVVTFNRYKPNSSFEGANMVEKYSPNLLGAEVFPHSNWELPVIPTEVYADFDGANKFEVGEIVNDLY